MRVRPNSGEEKRHFRRVLSAVPAEDDVLIRINGTGYFAAKLVDFSHGGVLIHVADPSSCLDTSGVSKLYFQNGDQLFILEGTLVRKQPPFLAFEFINVTELELSEIRKKLARMEIIAARLNKKAPLLS